MVGHVHVFERAIAEAKATKTGPTPLLPSTGLKPPGNPPQIRKATAPFIKGPIPLKWMTSAVSLSKGAALLAVALRYRLGLTIKVSPGDSGVEGKLIVRVDKQLREQCGLRRWHVGSGIRDLEQAGLIRSITSGRGHCPVVEVIT